MTTERNFYERSDTQAELDKEWSELPVWLTSMVEPYRFDAIGFPCALIPVGNDYTILDIGLVNQASGGSMDKATQFILSELIATCEVLVRSI